MVATFPVRPGDDVMLVTDSGRLIRLPADQVRITGRQAMGVTLLRLDNGERVTSCFPVLDGSGENGQEGAASDAGVAADGVVDGSEDGGRAGGRAMTRHVGVYPGTFDPVTNGHLDIIGRAARILDRLVVGVAINAGKGPLFPLEERVELVRAESGRHRRPHRRRRWRSCPSRDCWSAFARRSGAGVIVRGLRAVSDFDYEFQMAGMNHRLDHDIETVFLMASETHQFISSRFVKEIARLGGDVSSFVPKLTLERTLARVRGGPAPPSSRLRCNPSQPAA